MQAFSEYIETQDCHQLSNLSKFFGLLYAESVGTRNWASILFVHLLHILHSALQGPDPPQAWILTNAMQIVRGPQLRECSIGGITFNLSAGSLLTVHESGEVIATHGNIGLLLE